MDIQKLYPSATLLIGPRGRAMQILDTGGDVNQRNKFGKTPLLEMAEKTRSFPVVRALVDRGADVNAVDNIGCTALSTMLRYRLLEGNLQSVLYLIEHGANVNICDPIGQQTPLEFACHYTMGEGRNAIVRALLDHGAEVNTNSLSWTPLHWAAKYGDKELVQMLLEAGAVSVPNGDGDYPSALAKDEVKELFTHAKGAQCS